MKILFSTEASYLSSGYGMYGRNLIPRLIDRGFEVAELASFGTVNNGRDDFITWPFYAAAVEHNDPRYKEYMSQPENPYGAWRFDKVLLDFQPDIVFSIRDPWCMMHEYNSPLREYFNWVICPTVDSAPQSINWIEMFMNADKVLTYSEWGGEVIKKQSCNRINFHSHVYPGVQEVLKPTNKKEHRQKMGLEEDAIIFGTVMRNQKRKLYAELFKSFELYLSKVDEKTRQKSYLYIHTGYPDVGWDLPALIKEFNISSKVLFTYLCGKHKKPFISLYQGERTYSPFSNGITASLTSPGHGLTTEELADVFRCFDVYIQYANCLGKDEEILTKNGWKPIQDVNLGDLVFTHNNRYQKVINKFETPSPDFINRISVWGDYETLDVTDEHPILVYNNSCFRSSLKKSVRETVGTRLRNGSKLPDPVFVQTSDLKKNDLVVLPIDTRIDNKNTVDISNYRADKDTISAEKISINYGKTYPRQINIKEEFCRFIGLFAADGCAALGKSNQNIKITCHSEEFSNIEFATKVMEEFSDNVVKIREYPTRQGVDVILHSRLHNTCFRDWFYTEAGDKKLPNWVLTLKPELQKEIIHGMFMGDGHIMNKPGKSTTCTYTTTSKRLADDLKHLLHRCKIYYNVHLGKKPGKRKDQYRFEIAGNIKEGEFNLCHQRINTRCLYINDSIVRPIKDIENVEYDNKYVYNIEVENDNSYVVRQCCTHNCEGSGMPLFEAAACGIPVMAIDYSAMTDTIRLLNGEPLKYKLYRDFDIGADRAVPDNEYLAEMMKKWALMDSDDRIQAGLNANKQASIHFDWDKCADVWASAFRSCRSTQDKWKSPKRNINIAPFEEGKDLPIPEFVEWIFSRVSHDYDRRYSLSALDLIRWLNFGQRIVSPGKFQPFTKEHAYNNAKIHGENKRNVETVRCGEIPLPREDFLDYARKQK